MQVPGEVIPCTDALVTTVPSVLSTYSGVIIEQKAPGEEWIPYDPNKMVRCGSGAAMRLRRGPDAWNL